MGTLLQTVSLPLFTVVRPGALGDIPATLREANLAFARALVVTGAGPTAALGRRVATALEDAGVSVRVEEVTAPTFDEVDRVKRDLVEAFYPDLLLAVGGGSVIDVVKLTAAERRLPWISVPTAASNDGFCSPVVVLRNNGGRSSVGGVMPLGVVADLDVLVGSTRRLRLAGMGDLLSNFTACTDWRLAAERGKASLNGMALTLARAGARQVLATAAPDADDPAFLERVVEGLVLSGLAMEVCGTSRPCSGSEHLVSHQLDHMAAGNGLHGEQVGLATIFCSVLHGDDPAPLQAFAAAAGMIATPEDIGVSREEFVQAARLGPETRPGRWTALSIADEDDLQRAYNAAFPA